MKWQSTAAGCALVACIGALDFLADVGVATSIFYLLPIALVAWTAGLRPAAVLSILSAAVWYSADSAGGHLYAHPAIGYWNAAVRGAVFLVTAVLVARLREARDHAEEMRAAARAATLARSAPTAGGREVRTPSDLEAFAAGALEGRKVVVVSNREPYMHRRDAGPGGEIRCIRPAGGLVSALDPVLCAVGGTWIAHGAGDADRATADARGRIAVPPDAPRYGLRRVWLTKEEEAGYYYGLSNEALWPLCHTAYVRPTFRAEDWAAYETVNRRFADAVLDEIGRDPALVLVQDYHLARLPRLLKEARPDLGVAHFWHIPWPTHETFRICPWRREILEGLFGNDLVGFHLQYHCLRFLECVDAELQVRVDREHQAVFHGDRVTYVRPFPIGTDVAGVEADADSPEVAAETARLRRLVAPGVEALAVGVDRLDYTKGIPERLRAIDRFLAENPAWHGRFQYLGVAAPSREHIEAYRDLGDRVDAQVDEINWRHGTEAWRPIVLLREHAGPATTHALYRLGRLCLVTSLHDGMNLVAKEYVASHAEGDGVLVLSRFAGAAGTLVDALLVNPYDVAGTAGAIRAAVEMPEGERRARMARMRARVRERNVFDWARRLFAAAVRKADAPPPEIVP